MVVVGGDFGVDFFGNCDVFGYGVFVEEEDLVGVVVVLCIGCVGEWVKCGWVCGVVFWDVGLFYELDVFVVVDFIIYDYGEVFFGVLMKGFEVVFYCLVCGGLCECEVVIVCVCGDVVFFYGVYD